MFSAQHFDSVPNFCACFCDWHPQMLIPIWIKELRYNSNIKFLTCTYCWNWRNRSMAPAAANVSTPGDPVGVDPQYLPRLYCSRGGYTWRFKLDVVEVSKLDRKSAPRSHARHIVWQHPWMSPFPCTNNLKRKNGIRMDFNPRLELAHPVCRKGAFFLRGHVNPLVWSQRPALKWKWRRKVKWSIKAEVQTLRVLWLTIVKSG